VAGTEVEAGGHRLRYEEAGAGPAVLLLHAGSSDSTMWDDAWEDLARSYRVIRFDFPGAGGSPYPEKPFSTIELIDGLLDALDVPSVALVGVSLGGAMAIDYVLERPERVCWFSTVTATCRRSSSSEVAWRTGSRGPAASFCPAWTTLSRCAPPFPSSMP
jgi:pimeloyl-ACP methyl ester carboxylesterase